MWCCEVLYVFVCGWCLTCLCGLFVVSRVWLFGVWFCDAVFVWGARACCFNIMYVCVAIGMYCVMVYGLWLCVLRVCVGVSFNVLVCGVCVIMFEAVWYVVVWFVAVCDLLCGGVWFGLCVCGIVLCVCASLVICCVRAYGLSLFFVCVFVSACVECVRVL